MSTHIMGTVTRVFSKNANKTWFAGLIRFPDGTIDRIAGKTNTVLKVGMRIECNADYILANNNYGYQWQPEKGHYIRRVLTDRREVVSYLSGDAFRGVGVKTAEKIYDRYGKDTIRMLTENMPLVQQELGLRNSVAAIIANGLMEMDGPYVLTTAFPHMSLNTARRIIKEFSLKYSPDRICENINKANQCYDYLHDILHVSLRETDRIALEDLHVGELSGYRIEFLLEQAVYHFCQTYNGTYVRLSDDNDVNRLFYILTQKNLFYKPLPAYWWGQAFDPLFLLLHLQNNIMRPSDPVKDGGHVVSNYGRLSVIGPRLGADGISEMALYQTSVYNAEQRIADIISENYFIDDTKVFYKGLLSQCKIIMKHLSDMGQMDLSDEQQSAVRMACSHKMSFITGGPGRGKTRTLRVLIDVWRRAVSNLDKGRLRIVPSSILLLAPTGKAVNRMRAQTGYDNAETIARFLFVNDDSDKYQPVLTDAKGYDVANDQETLIIVDESSMLNFYDASRLLTLASECTFVFVGDENQLPPIDPGSFLHECLRSGMVHRTILHQNFRQVGLADTISINADKIIQGKGISGADLSDVFEVLPTLELPSGNEQHSQTEKLVISRYREYLRNGADHQDIMILAPFASDRYRASALNLNAVLQAELNPEVTSRIVTAHDDFGTYYNQRGCSAGMYDVNGLPVRIGDRVMNLKNNVAQEWYQFEHDSVGIMARMIEFAKNENKGIFNGDMGTVVRVYPRDGQHDTFRAVIELDDTRSKNERITDPQLKRYVFVDGEERGTKNGGSIVVMGDWSLSYALSIHKAQGSEADHIVIVLSESGYQATAYRHQVGNSLPFLTRNMLYTAVTRAQNTVVITGSKNAFQAGLATEHKYGNVFLAKAICEKVMCQMTAGDINNG